MAEVFGAAGENQKGLLGDSEGGEASEEGIGTVAILP